MLIRAPNTLVHVINILGESGQIDNAEVAASRGPSIGGRFANVVKTGPNKLPADEVVLLYMT